MNRQVVKILGDLAADGTAVILAGLLLAWGSLLRKNTAQLAKLRRHVTDDNQVLAVFWHGNFFSLFVLARGMNAVILTNDSFRGRVIAGISRRFGYRPVLLPAASGGNGLSVMIELFMKRPGLAALALDGPSGPYHRIRSGATYLSAHNGVRLVPVGVASERKITLTFRWDRQEIPLPGSRVALAVGDLIDLENLPTAGGPEALQAPVQRGMDQVTQEAQTILAAMKGAT